MKNKSVSMLEIVTCFLFLALFKPYALPQMLQQLIKICLLLVVGFYVLKNIKKIGVFNAVLPLCGCIIISSALSFFDGEIKGADFANGILYALCLYLLYIILKIYQRSDRYQQLLNVLFKMTTIYCIISLISISILGHTTHGTDITYFFGTKFMTSYYFILWLALFRNKYQSKLKNSSIIFKITYFVCSIFVVYICWYLYCLTATIAAAFLVVEQFVPEKIKKFLYNQVTMIIAFVLTGLFPFFFTIVATNQRIMYIVTDLFGKSGTFSGRFIIYNKLFSVINERKWFGYGYGNVAVEKAVGFGNAQNGMMEHLVQFGIIGVIALFIVIIRFTRNNKFYLVNSGWHALIYCMIICSIVEISFNYIFFLGLFAVGVFGNTKLDKKADGKFFISSKHKRRFKTIENI